MKQIPEDPIKEMYISPQPLVKGIQWLGFQGINVLHKANINKISMNLPEIMPIVSGESFLALRYDPTGYGSVALAILCGPEPKKFYDGIRELVAKSYAFCPEVLEIPRTSLENLLNRYHEAQLDY